MKRNRSRAWLAAATVALLAGTLGGMAPVSAHPGLPLSVFDPLSTTWADVRDRTDAQFDTAIAQWRAAGYLATDIEADMTANGTRRGVVFQRNTDGRDWIVEKELTPAQYSAAFDANEARGMRLIDWETYVRNGVRYIAAAWVKNIEGLGYHSLWGLTYAQALDYYHQQRSTRIPVDVDTYATGAGIRYALIWVDNPTHLDWRLHLDLSSAQFTANFNTYAGQGFRMLMVDSVRGSQDQRYAGIWYFNSNGRGFYERRDLTENQWVNWWHRYVDLGYRLITYERYETVEGWRYVGVWRQNNDRADWRLRGQVDARVQQEVNNFNVPGMSVAVIKDGEFVYKRGFGHADIANDVWLHSGHVMRLASVSKAVAGVLTMLMDEQNEINVGDQTSAHLALPAHHTHTLEQLASNRGCVRHYNGSAVDDTLAATEYNDATTPAALFWNDPLVCAVGEAKYSTHGYTVLCAALEQATGTPLPQLFVNRMTTPFGLGTLRPEDRDDMTVNRTKLYNTDNTEATADEISWKICGGGLESSVSDLARFGDKVIGGDIVAPASVEYMWTGTPWSYAYGWNEWSEDGHQAVGKEGAQRGANTYLLMYPDDGIVIAVTSNRKEGGHSAPAVAKAIGTLIIEALP